MADMQFNGRVWKFGDDINTDLMVPGFALFIPAQEQIKHCMSANRPGWVQQVQKGDVIVAGKDFGTGSARPGSRVLRDLGIACLLADGIDGTFFRNCVNFALPALELPGVSHAFEEGDRAEIDFQRGTVCNARSGQTLQARPWPEMLLDILKAGGIVPLLQSRGLVRQRP